METNMIGMLCDSERLQAAGCVCGLLARALRGLLVHHAGQYCAFPKTGFTPGAKAQ